MPTRKFQRKIENFVCGNCGFSVKGNGYTNHCPKCLWSRHVDNNPGDRESECEGMMEPIEAFQKNGRWVIQHQCQKCGHVKSVKTTKNDDFKKIIGLINKKNDLH